MRWDITLAGGGGIGEGETLEISRGLYAFLAENRFHWSSVQDKHSGQGVSRVQVRRLHVEQTECGSTSTEDLNRLQLLSSSPGQRLPAEELA